MLLILAVCKFHGVILILSCLWLQAFFFFFSSRRVISINSESWLSFDSCITCLLLIVHAEVAEIYIVFLFAIFKTVCLGCHYGLVTFSFTSASTYFRITEAILHRLQSLSIVCRAFFLKPETKNKLMKGIYASELA